MKKNEAMKMWEGIVLAMLLCIAMLILTIPAQAYTTEVHVVKYAADGTTILNETTVNHTWMEANLPVHGDGATHYYYQGPIFEEEWENTYGRVYTGDWSTSEEKWDRVNWGSGYVQEEQCNCYPNKDLGACKGTDVRDLCNLVGGMSPGDEVKIKAIDGFFKMFPYAVIYNNEPALGPYVLTWDSLDAEEGGASSGYTGPDYTTGMRAMFFSDTSTNPWGKHITGIGDMTNYIPEEYWHYYVNWPIFYPALGGYTVKYVSEIAIYRTELPQVFDTGAPDNPYPSISGTHTGTIKPNHDVCVNNMYTYPCLGTGGHTEYVKIENSSWNITANWTGYKDDWHNISFGKPFTLIAGETYNYTVLTGSYPQIIHKQNHTTLDGSFINCTGFADTNGTNYNNRIPAIRLDGGK